MRILVVCDAYYPSRFACAVRMKVLVEVLRECGHDVQVLSSNTSLTNPPEGYDQPNYVHFFPVVEMGKKTIINRLKNNLSGASGAVKAARLLGRFDLVIVSSPPVLMVNGAMRIARFNRAKFVLDVRDVWPDVGIEMGTFSKKSLYALVFKRILDRAYAHADLVTTVSPGKIKKLSERMPKGQESKVKMVANGLDLDFVAQKEDPRVVTAFNLDEGPTCVYIGNIGLAQGLETIIALAIRRSDVRFLLFGEGASKESLEVLTTRLGLCNVTFCGTLDSQGVYTVLRHASVSFVPLVSSNLSDSIPTKMFEAMGCGCPVLLAAQGDSVEVLKDIGLGLSVSPEDIDGLGVALDKLIDEPFTSDKCMDAAAYVADNYSRQHDAMKLNMFIASMEGC